MVTLLHPSQNSVFSTIKVEFFGFYVNDVTLADGMGRRFVNRPCKLHSAFFCVTIPPNVGNGLRAVPRIAKRNDTQVVPYGENRR